MSSLLEKNLNVIIQLVITRICLSEFGIIAATGVDIWSLTELAVYFV